jgi:hypothetical protein
VERRGRSSAGAALKGGGIEAAGSAFLTRFAGFGILRIWQFERLHTSNSSAIPVAKIAKPLLLGIEVGKLTLIDQKIHCPKTLAIFILHGFVYAE